MANSTPIRSILDPGEELLWEGQPRRGLDLPAYEIPFTGFAIMWTAISAFFIWLSAQTLIEGQGRDVIAVAYVPLAFGFVFLMLGLYLLVGRHYWDARRHRRTYYGVTEDRALIVIGKNARQIRSHAITPFTDLELTTKKNNDGSVLFGRRSIPKWLWGPWSFGYDDSEFAFTNIRNAKQVYDIVRKIQREQK